MAIQCWIESKGKSLAAISHWPDCNEVRAGAVVVAGFSQSMCDIDYFMSKLARRLTRQGMFVVQIDPRGHGDSRGDLAEVSLQTLREDIKCGIDYATHFVGDNVFGIGRGLSATILAEYIHEKVVRAVAGVSPYCLDIVDVKKIWQKTEQGIYEFADLIPGEDYAELSDFDIEKVGLIEALGALIYNLHGQKISTNILKELSNYDSKKPFQSDFRKGLWLFPNNSAESPFIEWVSTNEKPYRSSEQYVNNSFIRHPTWQYKIIEYISSWIEKLNKNSLEMA